MNPPELTEAGVAAWLREVGNDGATYLDTHLMARAVLALVEAKCRESCRDLMNAYASHVSYGEIDEIVSRVMKGTT